jgi:hypothetical protein
VLSRLAAEPIEVHPRAAKLLAEIGCEAGAKLVPLGAGGNNRLYRVECGSRSYVIKEYFRHPGDPRDRLGAEFAFLRFAWAGGLRCIPEAIASDTPAGLGLYGYIEGEPITPGAVSQDEIRQAMAFIRYLNRCRGTHEARELPPGSEACFSIHQHLDVVQKRIDRLNEIVPVSPVDDEAVTFIRTELAPAFVRVTEHILARLKQERLEKDIELPPEERLLSPSDFGFHNALRRPDGTIAFLDFEYAGWDDPAKLTGDFFNQVAVPVPLAYKEEVLAAVAEILPERESALRRMHLLLPVYRIKWCCILLNHFLPVASDRRAFAQGTARERKKEQLNKARTLLASLEQVVADISRN